MVIAPDCSDLVWLDISPQAGMQQAGKRPALVLSPRKYNETVGLMIVCPVTSKAKGYPFEVALPPGLGISGVILSDHVKSLDWRARNDTVIEKVPEHVIEEVKAKLKSLLTLN